jgi:tetratricopeptide (TPR) repeat protein
MAAMSVSRLATLLSALAACLPLAAGCASGKPSEVQRLQARAAYERGLIDLGDGRMGVGLAALREAVALDGDAALYRTTLGKWLLNLKQPEPRQEAIAELRKAVELEPLEADAHHSLGVAYAEDGRWEEAIKAYRQALSIPTFAEPEVARHNLGLALYSVGRLKEAEDSLRLAISLDPAFFPAYYTLGLVLVSQSRPEEAKQAFRRAHELAPDSPFGGAAARHLKALGEGG